ncbi:MAG: hypothetical protein OIF32_12400 [Campylobacterales bacterium]|nr:hypothetical protein [Campylobacterales bacterium]
MKHLLIYILLSSVLLAETIGDNERRRSQEHKFPGYFLVPFPYSLPGIGKGLGIVGISNNIKQTQTDLLATAFIGDVEGGGGGIKDFYLFDKRLKAEFFYQFFNKAQFQNYNKRGMDTKKNDYFILSVDKMEFLATRLTLSYYERMLEFYILNYYNRFKLGNITDIDGNIETKSDGNYASSSIYTSGFIFDYTDDRTDPRGGIRFETSVNYTPKKSKEKSKYYVWDRSVTGYIPVGRQSTIAVNYFRSDSILQEKGETDFYKVAEDISVKNCIQGSGKSCEDYVNNQIAENRYGTASSIGGRSRLRAYTEKRFFGAHTEFYGAEFRWNMTEEKSLFDLWFMKDMRTNVQTAFFYEVGSVADDIKDLGKTTRDSYGMGLRMLTGSGLVYRLDMATADEGSEVTMIINYPWEIF